MLGTREDKARDTISEIEELKRKEMLYRENMQLFHPRWGRENHLYPSLTLPIPLSGKSAILNMTIEGSELFVDVQALYQQVELDYLGFIPP